MLLTRSVKFSDTSSPAFAAGWCRAYGDCLLHEPVTPRPPDSRRPHHGRTRQRRHGSATKRRLRPKPAPNPAPYRIKSQPCGRHTELQGFMQAARQRLPSASRLYGSSSTMEALKFSSILAAAQNLHASHPRFQAYAAAEPERRAQAAREAEQRAAAARHELERAAEEERRLAAKQAEIEKTFNEWRKRRRPSPGPGMG